MNPAEASGDTSGPEAFTDRFLFGASVYPENLSRTAWLSLLDDMERARFRVLRLGESAWGHLEPERGRYAFGWLAQALSDMHERGLKAILGTSTYIAPQWLFVDHPDALAQLEPGVAVHPMYRKAASLCHPGYREACRAFVSAYSAEFSRHPAVIGWQLDNEIDALSMLKPDYSRHGEDAWTAWLARIFGTPEAMNERLGLAHWGWSAPSFEAVPQPRYATTEGSARLPALTLANLRFRRDLIAEFLAEQAAILRGAGVAGWITSNWMTNWTTLADDPEAGRALDVASLNVYPLGPDRVRYWREHAWFLDAARSAHGQDRFLVTETRIGVTGTTQMLDAFPSRAEFRMWMLRMAAFGAAGLIYWSGHRWHAGHWPHWGGLIGWSGEPEPDFEWVVELGETFARWERALLGEPVLVRAAVVTDFEQRAALQTYQHSPGSRHVLPAAFEAFYRLGIGVDGLATALIPERLARYEVIVMAGAPVTPDPEGIAALDRFVRDGGTLIIGPFVSYHSADGPFEPDGPGASLAGLAGARIRSLRRLGTVDDPDGGRHEAAWRGEESGGRSTLTVDGYCELLHIEDGTEILATLRHEEPILDGQPLASRRRLGAGTVIRLGFWPGEDGLERLLARCLASESGPLPEPFPPGVCGVPRRDGSLFLINTNRRPVTVRPPFRGRDRLSARVADREMTLAAFDVVWLEPDEPT